MDFYESVVVLQGIFRDLGSLMQVRGLKSAAYSALSVGILGAGTAYVIAATGEPPQRAAVRARPRGRHAVAFPRRCAAHAAHVDLQPQGTPDLPPASALSAAQIACSLTLEFRHQKIMR